MKILVINGPNINLLGIREPEVYGKSDYNALVASLDALSRELGVAIDVWQSNIEGEIVTKIQQARDEYDGIVINPGAYTHYSIALLDALKAVCLPAVEVHLSNIAGREDFRHTSVIAAGCIGQISGLGFDSYRLAVEGLVRHIERSSEE
jgi:3-dehydroquinate dehydratase-2